MDLKKKICFCTQSLSSRKFIFQALIIFQITALLGLFGLIVQLCLGFNKTHYESYKFGALMVFNIIINLIIFHSIVSFEQRKWGNIKCFAISIITLKISRLLVFTFQSLVVIVSNCLEIKLIKSRDKVVKVISLVISECSSLIIGSLLFVWMIYLGFGILKMSDFLLRSNGVRFTEVTSSADSGDDFFNTQIINF